MHNTILVTTSLEEVKKIIEEIIDEKFTPVFKIIQSKTPPIKFYTRRELAQLLSISLPTLSKWTAQGIITSTKVGSNVRYSHQDLERFMNDRNKNRGNKVTVRDR